MIDDILEDAELRMMGAVHSLEHDLAGYRTGRASTGLVERLVVEFYGTEMKLNQMATISIPEPQQIAIRPYDASSVSAVERAIMKSDLGMMPNSDGKIIRLNLPPLNEERRRELSRQVHKRVEDAKIAVRNVRRDAINDIRALHTDKKISEDDSHGAQDGLQKLTDKYVEDIDRHGKEKEAEIMEV
jgi:ribosome recycling factor